MSDPFDCGLICRQRQSQERFASVGVELPAPLWSSKPDSFLVASVVTVFMITSIFNTVGKTDKWTSVRQRNQRRL